MATESIVARDGWNYQPEARNRAGSGLLRIRRVP